MSQQREAFEKWAEGVGYSDFRWSKSALQYDNIFTNAQWEGWQACASEHAELLRKAVQALGETSAMLSACRLVVSDPVSRAQMTEAFGAAESTLALLRQHIEEKR